MRYVSFQVDMASLGENCPKINLYEISDRNCKNWDKDKVKVIKKNQTQTKMHFLNLFLT